MPKFTPEQIAHCHTLIDQSESIYDVLAYLGCSSANENEIAQILSAILHPETRPANVEAMYALTERVAATYERKNADYGDSFGKSFRKYGPISALTRMSDKWNRLENLILNGSGPKVADEAISDTLLDLATYALMTYIALESTVVEDK